MPPITPYLLWPALAALGVTLLLVSQPLGAPRERLADWLARQDVGRRQAARANRLAPEPAVVPWPAMDRILGPLLLDTVRVVGRLQARLGWHADPHRLAEIRLVRPEMTATRWLFERLAMATLLGVAPALVGGLFRTLGVPDAFLGDIPPWAWASLAVVGYLAPEWAANRALAERRRRLRAALPALLQSLVIGSSAGLSLQACLRLVARDGAGPLVELIQGVIHDLDAGRLRSTSEALADLALLAAIPEIDRVVQRLIGNTAAGAGFQHAVREMALGLQAADRTTLAASGQARMLKQLGVAAAFLLLPILLVFFFPLVVMVKEL